jgi:hypothetical protein
MEIIRNAGPAGILYEDYLASGGEYKHVNWDYDHGWVGFRDGRKGKLQFHPNPIVTNRRNFGALEQLDQQIIDVLSESHPQSVRHVFYRMTDPRLPEPVEKTEAGYSRVQARLVQLRRNARVPYEWVIDSSRSGLPVATSPDAGSWLASYAQSFRSDPWALTDYYCQVWCESRSLAGVLANVCDELAVGLFPSAGFSSMSFAFETAQIIKSEYIGRNVIIFYIGDYDPAGVLIDVALERELREHLSGIDELRFERLAITKQQIAKYKLPTKPRKPGDRRALEVRATVEAEAMPAETMVKLLRDQVLRVLPKTDLQAAAAFDQKEIRRLQRAAKLLTKSRR